MLPLPLTNISAAALFFVTADAHGLVVTSLALVCSLLQA